jgi:hypothetical protein
VAPSFEDGLARVMIASRKSRGEGIVCGPVSAVAVTVAPEIAPASAVTATWKASNSFFAELSAAGESSRALALGRTFSLELVTHTWAARALSGKESRRARIVRESEDRDAGRQRWALDKRFSSLWS